jgi:Helix-turn-helix domain
MSAPSTYLRPRDVAERFDVKVDVVLAWIRRAELVAVNVAQVGGRRPRWRIAQADLQRFVERRQAVPAPARQRRRRRAPQPAPAPMIFYQHGRRLPLPEGGAA